MPNFIAQITQMKNVQARKDSKVARLKWTPRALVVYGMLTDGIFYAYIRGPGFESPLVHPTTSHVLFLEPSGGLNAAPRAST